MQRVHVHVEVSALESAVGFDSELGAEPIVLKSDQPNGASTTCVFKFGDPRARRQPGGDHLGIEVDSREELQGPPISAWQGQSSHSQEGARRPPQGNREPDHAARGPRAQRPLRPEDAPALTERAQPECPRR
jgi:hypothetical protein